MLIDIRLYMRWEARFSLVNLGYSLQRRCQIPWSFDNPPNAIFSIGRWNQWCFSSNRIDLGLSLFQMAMTMLDCHNKSFTTISHFTVNRCRIKMVFNALVEEFEINMCQQMFAFCIFELCHSYFILLKKIFRFINSLFSKQRRTKHSHSFLSNIFSFSWPILLILRFLLSKNYLKSHKILHKILVRALALQLNLLKPFTYTSFMIQIPKKSRAIFKIVRKYTSVKDCCFCPYDILLLHLYFVPTTASITKGAVLSLHMVFSNIF